MQGLAAEIERLRARIADIERRPAPGGSAASVRITEQNAAPIVSNAFRASDSLYGIGLDASDTSLDLKDAEDVAKVATVVGDAALRTAENAFKPGHDGADPPGHRHNPVGGITDRPGDAVADEEHRKDEHQRGNAIAGIQRPRRISDHRRAGRRRSSRSPRASS